MSITIRVSNGDWYTDSRGRFIWISLREKVAQDVANAILQDLYSDGSWGSELNRAERSAIVDTISAHKALIQSLVSEAVDRLLVFQEQEEDIPDTEKIAEYTVIVERMPQKSLSYFYYLSVLTEGSDEPLKQTYVIDLQQVNDPILMEYTAVGES